MNAAVISFPSARLRLRTAALIAFSLLFACSSHATPQPSEFRIYDDALAPGWIDISHFPQGLLDYQYSNNVHSGSYSISYQGGARDTAVLMISPNASIDTTGYTHLRLWAYVTDTDMRFIIYGLLTFAAPTWVYNYPTSTGWQEISVPLTDLQVANSTNFDGFMIQGLTGRVPSGNSLGVSYLLDDISLVSVPEPGTASLIAVGLACTLIWRRAGSMRIRR